MHTNLKFHFVVHWPELSRSVRKQFSLLFLVPASSVKLNRAKVYRVQKNVTNVGYCTRSVH